MTSDEWVRDWSPRPASGVGLIGLSAAPRDGFAAIYTLRDPETGEALYVGQSLNPAIRYHQHCIAPGKARNPRAVWLRALRAQGLKPIMDIIAWVKDGDRVERAVIAILRAAGFPLLNIEDGGGKGFQPIGNAWAAHWCFEACLRAGHAKLANRLRLKVKWAKHVGPDALRHIDEECATILPPMVAARLGYKVQLALLL